MPRGLQGHWPSILALATWSSGVLVALNPGRIQLVGSSAGLEYLRRANAHGRLLLGRHPIQHELHLWEQSAVINIPVDLPEPCRHKSSNNPTIKIAFRIPSSLMS